MGHIFLEKSQIFPRNSPILTRPDEAKWDQRAAALFQQLYICSSIYFHKRSIYFRKRAICSRKRVLFTRNLTKPRGISAQQLFFISYALQRRAMRQLNLKLSQKYTKKNKN